MTARTDTDPALPILPGHKEKPARVPFPGVPGRGVFITDGWRRSNWQPVLIAARIAAAGFTWAATQADDTPDGIGPAFVQAMHARDLRAGVWEPRVDYGTPARVAQGYDFYIGQVEGPGQYDRLVASLAAFRAAHPTMPAACVTNFGGLDDQNVRPLIEAGFACITESHVRESVGTTIEAQLDYARRVLGWPDPQPMIGLGAGATRADYPGWETYPGVSVFTAEQAL